MRRLKRLSALVTLCFLSVSPAAAHDAIGDLSPFWMGLLHIYFTPLAMAAVVGLMAAISFAISRSIYPSIFLTALTACGTVLWFPETFRSVAPFGIAVVGLMAAWGRVPLQLIGLLLGLISGVGVGSVVELDAVAVASAMGLGAGVIVTCVLIYRGFEYALTKPKMRVILPVACRIIGAWVAAVALLLGALAIKRSL